MSIKKYSIAIIVGVMMCGGFSVFAQGPTEVNPVIRNDSLRFIDDACDPAKGTYNCYQLLEPIPLDGRTIDSIDTTATGSEGGIGGFINFMFEMGIGVAGILGVVMLVIYGFQYASNDKNIKTFSDLKVKITNVILGLLLLLSIFIILQTINPDLVLVEPEIKTQYLDIEERGDGFVPGDSISGDQVPVGTTSTKSCPKGVVAIYGINVCKSVSEDFKRMIDDAKRSGINLGGGGHRTLAQQISLRVKNCGGNSQFNVYEKSSSLCRPPTAKPGSSRHESGLAVDLTCDGATIKSKDNKCFLWLKQNAAKYGFYNLPSEPWHWSIDGK